VSSPTNEVRCVCVLCVYLCVYACAQHPLERHLVWNVDCNGPVAQQRFDALDVAKGGGEVDRRCFGLCCVWEWCVWVGVSAVLGHCGLALNMCFDDMRWRIRKCVFTLFGMLHKCVSGA
jgi:hypothetical protein